ncbi:YihY/virulence factor BrkB family protein [Hansschlegelia quercus]|uniref:YihY/virulence factor BrkB family protein n=1 Tax=Hansschlegelia quercus TaxID=2528245 RepID=A0A4Q9GHA1_9HYPH|nr:YihY/virulence factor BrkB family protein [Hansschlegelia quercus]TBN53412.1 YihY/virulence factor BrkB family protein [Hansschlegelia quercus]
MAGMQKAGGAIGGVAGGLLLGASALAALGVAAAAAYDGARAPRAEAALSPEGDLHSRGKDVATPVKLPARGWKEIVFRVYSEIAEDRLLAVAAGVTFYALLAIFPAMVALVSLYGLTADVGTLNDHLAAFSGLIPRSGIELIRDQVTRLVTKSDGTLGFAFVFGLGAAIWSANAGMKALFDALNVVYGEHEKRSFVMLNALSLAFTGASLAFVIIAFNAVVVLPIVLQYIWLGSAAEALLSFARWPALLLCMLSGLAMVYRFGPSRRSPKWRWAAPGSLLAAVLWIAGSLAFSFYAENFASYDKTYGSLGAAIAFMTWIWMSVIVVLLGGELNAEMEHQTVKDTTVGAPKPLGMRGAKMADTVAP